MVRMAGSYAWVPWEYRPSGQGGLFGPDMPFPTIPNSQPLSLEQGTQGLCSTETCPAERQDSWEAKPPIGHMDIRLGPECQPERAQVFWIQDCSRSGEHHREHRTRRAPGRSVDGKGASQLGST